MHLYAPGHEQPRDDIGRAVGLQAKLGMGVDIAADAGELSVMRAQARERRVADNWLGHSTSPWLGDASVAEGQELLVKIARARPRRLLLCKCSKSLPPTRTVASHCRMARQRANAVCQHDQR